MLPFYTVPLLIALFAVDYEELFKCPAERIDRTEGTAFEGTCSVEGACSVEGTALEGACSVEGTALEGAALEGAHSVGTSHA